MEYILIAAVALFASGLTLFSGFGLGTILLPAFALFFPVEIAITLTAIVHFLNNIFKLYLMAKHAEISIVLKFGIPAIIAAYLGAELLTLLSGSAPLFTYNMFSKNFEIEPVKLVVAILILFFALFELVPRLRDLSFDKKYLPAGGLLSGFFGGLSGHQGALRSAFLIKMGLNKESFIATGIVIAVFIDVARLFVYSTNFFTEDISTNIWLLVTATIAAFAGAYIGKRLLKKITYSVIQKIVGIMLILIGIGLGMGTI